MRPLRIPGKMYLLGIEMGSWGLRRPTGEKKAGCPIRMFPREWGQRMTRGHSRRSATEQGIRLSKGLDLEECGER